MPETDAIKSKGLPGTPLDPVEHAVISQALMATGKEMGVKLIRSSYSNIVREAQDASAALFDRDGRVIAQAELIPMQLGPMSDIFRACADVVPPDALEPTPVTEHPVAMPPVVEPANEEPAEPFTQPDGPVAQSKSKDIPKDPWATD